MQSFFFHNQPRASVAASKAVNIVPNKLALLSEEFLSDD